MGKGDGKLNRYRLVRGSEVQDFLRCRKRWKWRWVDKLAPKRQDGKLFFGNLFHKFVEEYYNSGQNQDAGFFQMRTLFDETDTSRMEQVEVDELWNLADAVTENYVQMWKEADKKIQVIATEFTFAIPLAEGIAYTGTIDMIYLDSDGRLWFKDYKTTNTVDKYIKKAKMDRQISRYFWALNQLAEGNGYILTDVDKVSEEDEELMVHYTTKDWVHVGDWIYNNVGALPKPHGFIYDVVARKVPKVPEILKKGGLSKNKAQDTTYGVYLKALHDNNLMDTETIPGRSVVPEEYFEILDHLKSQEDEYGNRFFKRIQVFRHSEELESAIQEFFAAAVEMVRLKEAIENGTYEKMEYDPIYRNITDDCSWDCPFEGLCVADMDGSYTDALLPLMYDERNDELGQDYLYLGN